MRLEGRRALVVGGGRGLGRACATRLAVEGCSVVVADVIDTEAVAGDISSWGGKAEAAIFDAKAFDSPDAVVGEAAARTGHIDILVNAMPYPDVLAPTDWGTMTVDEWDQVFAMNVRNVWLFCRAVAPHMKAQRYGKIVNVSSSAVWEGTPGYIHYVTAKSALLGLGRSLARELGEFNIAVNTVSPSMMKDQGLPPDILADATGSILFLTSPEADFITGQNWLVNGGRCFL